MFSDNQFCKGSYYVINRGTARKNVFGSDIQRKLLLILPEMLSCYARHRIEISSQELCTPKSGRENRWRATAIYLARQLSEQSLVEIGSWFGISGPATSVSLKRFDTFRKKNPDFNKDVEALEAKFKSLVS